ncbi:MAG: DUF3667 domain-containing protein [Caulobacter sp.]
MAKGGEASIETGQGEGEAAAPKPRVRKPRAKKPVAPAIEETAPPAMTPVAQAADELPTGAACQNCGTRIVGHFCHECGQKAHLHNRLRHLVEEFIEGIAHFDGRLWRTLPILLLNPGRLSREWREGKRVRYVAPLHVFLFAVFLLFLIPSLTGDHLLTFGPADAAKTGEAVFAPVQVDGDLANAPGWVQWLVGFVGSKQGNAAYYGYKIETTAYKLSFLTVPLSMGILWLLLLFKRGYTLYDHGVVSLYGLGVFALVASLTYLLPDAWQRGALEWTVLAALVHAVIHLKGAYQLKWWTAVPLGVLLSLLSVIGFTFFLLVVVGLGLAG